MLDLVMALLPRESLLDNADSCGRVKPCSWVFETMHSNERPDFTRIVVNVRRMSATGNGVCCNESNNHPIDGSSLRLL